MLELSPLVSKSAEATAAFIKLNIIARHGVPQFICTDNGTEFCGSFHLLLHKYGIEHQFGNVAYP